MDAKRPEKVTQRDLKEAIFALLYRVEKRFIFRFKQVFGLNRYIQIERTSIIN